MSITYRHFRNPDSPALMALWNHALKSRSCAVISKPNLLEAHMMAKPWFDPRGVLLAVDDQAREGQHVVGAAVTGFGMADQPHQLDRQRGVVALLTVHPEHRRQKIGSTLLRQAEDYLHAAGTRQLHVGCSQERTPYFWGLLGSSSPTGILDSYEGMEAILQTHGYQTKERVLVLARDGEQPVPMGDPRFPALRRKYSLNYHPRRATSWKEETLQGPLEAVIFQLVETAVDRPVAEVRAWDMVPFVPKAQPARVGIYGLEVNPAWRRQGLGKYLLCLLMQHLEEQMYGQLEAAVLSSDEPAVKLLTQLKFLQVDEGHVYFKEMA